ncbi:MAG: tripartite tricarboxylate transporter substrate binding protein BugE [Burkholderiaceae bacterium]
MICRVAVSAGLSLFAALLLTANAQAQFAPYPNQAIRLLVPFAAGGSSDIVARAVADPLGKALGTSVIVENRSGGGGAVGAAETARATPDGYSLGVATLSTTATNPAINPKIPYDPIADFTPIVNIAAVPSVLAVNPSFPAKDLAGLLAELKRNPSKYAFATASTSGSGHLQMELFKSLTGTAITHVPYRGSGPALNDTVAGQVPMIFDSLPSALPFIKDGRLVAIAITAPTRQSSLPNVPTFKEAGLEPMNRMAYYGLYGPKNLPAEIVNKIHAGVKTALADPAVRERLEGAGALIVGNTPAQFAQQVKETLAVYKKVVADAKLKLD